MSLVPRFPLPRSLVGVVNVGLSREICIGCRGDNRGESACDALNPQETLSTEIHHLGRKASKRRLSYYVVDPDQKMQHVEP